MGRAYKASPKLTLVSSVVHDHARGEALAGSLLQPPQTAEIGRRDRNSGHLDPPGILSPPVFARILDDAAPTGWVVYARPPFDGPTSVLSYLARYTHRTAISNHRLLDVSDDSVTFLKSESQLVFGLLMTPEGVPVAVEVFAGNTGDPSTVGPVLDRIQERFGLRKVTVVGDRGMLTEARITAELRPRELDWITSLRAPTIRKLHEEGPLQLSLFDERDLAEITSPDFPGERLIACRNPLLARERARKREVLVQATDAKLETLVKATARKKNPLRGKGRIGVRAGKILGGSKVAKHFRYEVTDDAFRFERDRESIARAAALDGIYVIRTSVSAEALTAEDVVRAYKGLSVVEQAFRVTKDFALEVEPIRHRREDRIRAHVFLCMLAFYVRKHMEQALAPMLFVDHDPRGGDTERRSIVAPAVRSSAARTKIRRKCGDDGLPGHAFKSLMDDLATLTKNTVRMGDTEVTFQRYARPTELQQRALDLLGVSVRLT